MQGVAGPQGPRGPTGVTGIAGPQGTRGPAGPTGAQGITGQAGAQGLLGVPGPSTNPVNVQILVSTTTETTSLGPPRGAVVSAFANAYPPLSGGNSTTISGLSVSGPTITIPAGRYFIEAATSFPYNYNLQTCYFSMYDPVGNRDILAGNQIKVNTPVTAGTFGYTSYISGILDTEYL